MGDRRVIATSLFNYSRSVFWTKDVDSIPLLRSHRPDCIPLLLLKMLRLQDAVPGIVSRLLPLLYPGMLAIGAFTKLA